MSRPEVARKATSGSCYVDRTKASVVCSDGVDEGALSDARGERSGPTCGAVGLRQDVVLGPGLSPAESSKKLSDPFRGSCSFRPVHSKSILDTLLCASNEFMLAGDFAALTPQLTFFTLPPNAAAPPPLPFLASSPRPALIKKKLSCLF